MTGSGLKHVLYCLADDELIVGHRNSEWTGLAPILEEDIAFASMAQDEIGHALTYYRLLHELGEADPDKLAFRRAAEDFRCAHLVEWPRTDWAFSLMRQFLYDAGESVRLAALGKSSYEPLAQAARKLAGEEKYHLMHGKAWIERLGKANDDSHKRMQVALDLALPLALGLFEESEWEAELAAEGIKPTEVELRNGWLSLVMPVLNDAGLAAPEAEPVLGGRAGRHTEHMTALLDDMQFVYRSDPEAEW